MTVSEKITPSKHHSLSKSSTLSRFERIESSKNIPKNNAIATKHITRSLKQKDFVGNVLSQAVTNELSATSFDVIVRRQRKVLTGTMTSDCSNMKVLQRFTVIQGQRAIKNVNSSRVFDGLTELLAPESLAVAFYDVPKSEVPGRDSPAPAEKKDRAPGNTLCVDSSFDRMVNEIENGDILVLDDNNANTGIRESGFFVLNPKRFDVTELELTVTIAVGGVKVSVRSERVSSALLFDLCCVLY